MRQFSNAEPITVDYEPIGTVVDTNPETVQEPQETNPVDVDLDITLNDEDTQDPTQQSTEETKEVVEVDFDKEEVEGQDNPQDFYLNTINNLFEKGVFDQENVYEGFSDDTEPSEEVLQKFIEHNIELKAEEKITDFFSKISPLGQRILEYDLNSKGDEEELLYYLGTLNEENNIKSLDPENEYDQEVIVRKWFQEDKRFNAAEVEEKVQDLKTAGLLGKEAKILKPKLDAKAEEIAKKQEESKRYMQQVEAQRKEQFYDRVESIIQKGKVGNMTLGKETAQKVATMLMLEDVPVKLPEGRELKMNLFEAEIFKHKYSSKGNPELLVQVAYLLADPEGFYAQFAKKVQTEEVNKFIRDTKYRTKTGSNPSIVKQPEVEKPKQFAWNRPPVKQI